MQGDSAAQFQNLAGCLKCLSPQERLVCAYLSIRDIPYGSPNSPSPSAVIERNRGTGKGKHLLLKMVLSSLGYDVRQYWARHDFSRLPINPWPEALMAFRGVKITGFHDFLKVHIGNRWVTVDATYDGPLESLGFPVHAWDGLEDTPLSVAVEETFPVEEPIDEHKRRLVAALPETMRQKRKEFLKTLKKWLEEERERSGHGHTQ